MGNIDITNPGAEAVALRDAISGLEVLPTGASTARTLANYLSGSSQLVPAFKMHKWRRALGRVISGGGRAIVLCHGDSTTLGLGSAGAGVFTNCTAKSYPSQLANILSARGIPARQNGKFGVSGAANTDARVVYDAAWSGGSPTLGGATMRNSTTTSSWSCTPTGNVDTFKLWFMQVPGYGTFTINADGGSALATVNSDGASALGAVTVTTTLGTHTFNVQRNGTGGAVSIVGWVAYDSTKSEVIVIQAGHSGAKAQDGADTSGAWGARNVLTAIAPDLTIVGFGTNDETAGTALSTFSGHISSILTAAKASGDAFVIIPGQIDPALVSAEIQNTYWSAIRSAAGEETPVFDIPYRFGSFANATSAGFQVDSKHHTAIGYADISRSLAYLVTV